MSLFKRVRILRGGKIKKGPVVYWMGRDQRILDNWPLIYAQQLALKEPVPLIVVFNVVPSFLNATLRQYDFMLNGLKEVSITLTEKNIPVHILRGDPIKNIPDFLKEVDAGLLVVDFEPLKVKTQWKKAVSRKIKIPIHEVDGRNIVPCWLASDKQEYGAYTIRKKLHSRLNEFTSDSVQVQKHPYKFKIIGQGFDVEKIKRTLEVDKNVLPVGWIQPGEKAALKTLKHFINKRLNRYPSDRNDPSIDAQSNLSPYLHFGNISSYRIVREVLKSSATKAAKDAFIEEVFVRRELSDNFCFYNISYDAVKGIHPWAQKTLDKHKKDKREYLYSKSDLEKAKTHDAAWNAAQMEMVKKGKMHGYMRMYWAKKILEWSKTPEIALKNAIYLNDKYELDGRDTNGYAGILWAIGGLHDRPWAERKIFGQIRYMNERGLRSKFNIDKYLERVNSL